MYLAHSENLNGRTEPLYEHLSRVAERAYAFASEFDAGAEADIAGLLHDLGKYGVLFQRRLAGEGRGIDHWSAGASACLDRYGANGIASALSIQGHHLGLQTCDRDSLRSLLPKRLQPSADRQLSEPGGLNMLLQRLRADGLSLPALDSTLYDREAGPAASMLDVRMLFSALVDADFLETEGHFEGRAARESPARLLPGVAWRALENHLVGLAASSTASMTVKQLRDDLLNACLQAGSFEPGLYTLSCCCSRLVGLVRTSSTMVSTRVGFESRNLDLMTLMLFSRSAVGEGIIICAKACAF